MRFESMIPVFERVATGIGKAVNNSTADGTNYFTYTQYEQCVNLQVQRHSRPLSS
jgi:hypothetical protein